MRRQGNLAPTRPAVGGEAHVCACLSAVLIIFVAVAVVAVAVAVVVAGPIR